MNVESFLLGFVLCAQFFQTVVFSYAMWKYVYTPWKIVRKDQIIAREQNKNLMDELNRLKSKLKAEAAVLTDEQVAAIESRLGERTRVRNTFKA